MAIVILLLFFGGIGVFLYFKVPEVKKLINKALNLSAGGDVSEKRLAELNKQLDAEKARTKMLTEKAALAKKINDTATAIKTERTKQQQARVTIEGGK